MHVPDCLSARVLQRMNDCSGRAIIGEIIYEKYTAVFRHGVADCRKAPKRSAVLVLFLFQVIGQLHFSTAEFPDHFGELPATYAQ